MLMNVLTKVFGSKNERELKRLDPMVDEIEFVRLADTQLRDPEYLQRFVGEYELLSDKITITLKGEATLVLIVPGQPPYDLEPYKGTEFVFKDLEGYAVEFVMDDGKATQLVIKQPQGIFTAKRVE